MKQVEIVIISKMIKSRPYPTVFGWGQNIHYQILQCRINNKAINAHEAKFTRTGQIDAIYGSKIGTREIHAELMLVTENGERTFTISSLSQKEVGDIRTSTFYGLELNG